MGTTWFWGHGPSTPLSCGFRLSPRLPRSPMLHFPALDSSPCPFCFYGTKIEIKSETARKKKETPRVQRWKTAFWGGEAQSWVLFHLFYRRKHLQPRQLSLPFGTAPGGGFCLRNLPLIKAEGVAWPPAWLRTVP